MDRTGEEADWERLAPGVVRRRLPGWDATAGLVVGSRGALMVDAGSTLREGAELRQLARRFLAAPGPDTAADIGADTAADTAAETAADTAASGPGSPPPKAADVTHLVLTHPHFDHVLGAGAFTGVEVYGAVGLDMLLAEKGQQDLCEDAVRHGVPRDEAAEAAGLLVPPQHLVSGDLSVGLGDGREAVIANIGPGHSGHDLVVLVPGHHGAPSVVFCGDLVEESGAPQAGPDSVPGQWPAALDRLLALAGEEALYVPGHGAVVDAGFVRAQREELARRFGVS